MSATLKQVPWRPDYVGVALPFEYVMAPIPKNLPAFKDWPVAGEDPALDAAGLQASEDPNAASESQIAEIVPTGARAILGLVEDRGSLRKSYAAGSASLIAIYQ